MSDKAWCDDGEPWVGCSTRRRLEADNERLQAALREVRSYIKWCDHDPAIDTIDAALSRQEGRMSDDDKNPWIAASRVFSSGLFDGQDELAAVRAHRDWLLAELERVQRSRNRLDYEGAVYRMGLRWAGHRMLTVFGDTGGWEEVARVLETQFLQGDPAATDESGNVRSTAPPAGTNEKVPEWYCPHCLGTKWHVFPDECWMWR